MSWAVNSLRRVAADIRSYEDGRLPQDAADSFLLSLELVYREVLVQEQLDGHSTSYSRVCTMISGAVGSLRTNAFRTSNPFYHLLFVQALLFGLVNILQELNTCAFGE